MREGWGALGKQWDEPGPHGVVRIGDEHAVRSRQRSLLHIAEDKGRFDGAPVVELDPKKVLPTQEFLYRSNHDSVAKAPAGDLPPVDVVQKGRSHYVLDGHHRWAVAREAGRPLRARVVKYEPR